MPHSNYLLMQLTYSHFWFFFHRLQWLLTGLPSQQLVTFEWFFNLNHCIALGFLLVYCSSYSFTAIFNIYDTFSFPIVSAYSNQTSHTTNIPHQYWNIFTVLIHLWKIIEFLLAHSKRLRNWIYCVSIKAINIPIASEYNPIIHAVELLRTKIKLHAVNNEHFSITISVKYKIFSTVCSVQWIHKLLFRFIGISPRMVFDDWIVVIGSASHWKITCNKVDALKQNDSTLVVGYFHISFKFSITKMNKSE